MYKKIFTILYTVFTIIVFGLVICNAVVQNMISDIVLLKNVETTVEKIFPGKSVFRELYGFTNIILSPTEILAEGRATIKDEDGVIIEIPYVSNGIVKKALDNIIELNNVCENMGTDFMYVSYPSKINSDVKIKGYGIETNAEQSRIQFLQGLTDNGINVLNIRTLLEKDGYEIKDVFYRTDHHWKSTAGLYAARSIGEYVNDSFKYNLKVDLLDEENLEFTTYKELWLGEVGRKISKTWSGELDDFVEIRPSYETSFTVGQYGASEKREGDFSLLISDEGYNQKIDLYNYSAHYSYRGAESLTHIHNNNVEGKKILIIKDSFSVVVIPFLSLMTSDMIVWDMRSTPEGLYTFIEENNFDAVILAYTDYWDPKIYAFN